MSSGWRSGFAQVLNELPCASEPCISSPAFRLRYGLVPKDLRMKPSYVRCVTLVLAVFLVALTTTGCHSSATLLSPSSVDTARADTSTIQSAPRGSNRIELAPGEKATIRNAHSNRTDVICANHQPLFCDGFGRRRDCYCPRN